MTRWLTTHYARIVLGLLAFQYIFINLIFTSYTQNIVILKDLSAPLFSMLIFFFWILGDLAKFGRWQLPRHGIVPATVAALLFWLTSVIAGPTTSAGVYTWGSTWGYFVQVWALVRFMDTPKKMRFLVHVVIVTNVIIVVYGFSQFMGADILVDAGLIPDWGAYTTVSTHGNRNFFAGYLLTTVPVLIGYLFVTENLFLGLSLPVLIGFNVYEIMRINSFNASTALIISLPVSILFLGINLRHFPIFSERSSKRRFIGKGALLMISIVLAIWAARLDCPCFPFETLRMWRHYVTNGESSARLVLYQMALDGALRSPIFGRGLGGFNQLMPESRPADYHRRALGHNSDHPHNELLECLHDTGIIGLSFFCLILLVYAREGLRVIHRHGRGYYLPLIIFSFIGPWNLWLHAMSGVESRWTGNNVTLWFTVGFVLALANLPVIARREELEDSVHDDPPLADVPRILADTDLPESTATAAISMLGRPQGAAPTHAPYLSIVAIIMSIVVGYYIHTAYNFREADHHLRNNMAFTDGGGEGLSVHDALKEAELARSLCYTNMSGYYKLAYTYLVAGDMPNAMNAYRDLQAFAPNYAQIHINLAFLHDQLGNKTVSAWERDRAAIIEHNTKNHRDAANYWLQLGYPTRALAHLRHCLTFDYEKNDKDPSYCDGVVFTRLLWYDCDNVHADLARVYASLGQRDEAEQEIHQALEINSANISAAVFMTQLLTENHETGKLDALLIKLETDSPNNPASLIIKMTKAMEAKDYAEALTYADAVASTLSLPNGQPSQEASILGNSILASLQTIFAANYDKPKTLDVAGWIYATQGRYVEAEKFLQQSFDITHDPKTGEHLRLVKNNRGA